MFKVVGVVPQSFQLIGRSRIWGSSPSTVVPRARRALLRIADASAGRFSQDARADCPASPKYWRGNSQDERGRGVTLGTAEARPSGSELRLTSLLVPGVVGFVLLICCATWPTS